MTTLGARLAQNAIQHERSDTVYMLEQARKAGPEELKKFLQVQDFFTFARNEITDSIENGDAKIAIQVGGEPKSAPHMEIWHLLTVGCSNNDPMKAISSDRHPYHCLWRDFSDWATENELAVALECRHDGGGMYDWVDLVCKPSPPVARERPRAPRG